MRKTLLMLLLVGFVVTGSGRGADITPAGEKLARYLDGLDVENLWLPGRYVHWHSGKSSDTPIAGVGKSTHCSAFVAGACARLDVYILRPPEHRQILLANAQADWLRTKGRERGWHPVGTAWEAQEWANKGDLVVAVYKEKRTRIVAGKQSLRPGHVAIVRPSKRDRASIEKDGPQIIQAGGTNASSTVLRVGFKHHADAWEKREIQFHRHAIRWR